MADLLVTVTSTVRTIFYVLFMVHLHHKPFNECCSRITNPTPHITFEPTGSSLNLILSLNSPEATRLSALPSGSRLYTLIGLVAQEVLTLAAQVGGFESKVLGDF